MLTALVVATCAWNAPGVHAFTGSVPDAVGHYADIPAPVRARLSQRMARRDYDDVAEITRDSISGKHQYADLRAMHFGADRICNTVTRSAWTATAKERGLVYCDSGHCIIVPTVCRNVARVTPLDDLAPDSAAARRAAAEPLPTDLARSEAPPSIPAAPPAPSFGELSQPGAPAVAAADPAAGAGDSAVPEVVQITGPLIAAAAPFFLPSGSASCCIARVVVPGIDEPSRTALVIAGLAAIVGWRASCRKPMRRTATGADR